VRAFKAQAIGSLLDAARVLQLACAGTAPSAKKWLKSIFPDGYARHPTGSTGHNGEPFRT
jgi:hypothetical protein